MCNKEKKTFSDNEVRGERSHRNLSDKWSKQKMKQLRYTENAKEKYNGLTGSQRTFVDKDLDQLKNDDNNLTSHVINTELGITILFESNETAILITDILYEPYRQSAAYQDAQQRMDDWNN